MEAVCKNQEPISLGNKVRRIREISGMKQFTLAEKCNWSQQKMSKIENSETIDEEDLAAIAKNLGVTPDFIKNFRDEKAVYNIMNAYDSSENSENYQPVINNIGLTENLEKLLKKYLHDEQQKYQSFSELGKAVLDLVKEVRELKNKK